MAAADAAQATRAPLAGEHETLQLAMAGDRAAFARLVTRWQDRIYTALLRMTGNAEDAADLTQETFLKALNHLSTFRGQASVHTWLFRIAMNLAATRNRQSQRRRTIVAGQIRPPSDERPDVLDDRPSSFDSPDGLAQKHERDQQVMAALSRLPEDQRSLLVLRDVDGMDYQQIADVLAVPLGTLKSRLFRARLALRNELKSYFDGQEVVL